MIRGYNFPSGSEEKVTIDDSKVTEKMNLYSFRNQVTLDVNAPPSEPSGYTYQGELYDGSKLYMKTILTTVSGDSTNSSAGCTGAVLLIKPDGTQLSIAIPTYTIPIERRETGTYSYSCYLYPSPDRNIYLRLQRQSDSNSYQSIYELNIFSSSLTWTTKTIEIAFGCNKSILSDDVIIENDYIYIFSDGYIYGYKFGDTSYTFQKISTNSMTDRYGGFFARKGRNTYIYFRTCSGGNTIDKWISVTRNSNGTYSEASGTAYLSTAHKIYKKFMLNGEIYIQMLGYGSHSGYEGLQYYKLNSDNSAWKIAINFSTTATSYLASITNYFDGSPKWIFQGQRSSYSSHPPIVRSDGTFNLTVFTPGKLSFENLQTPTVNKTFGGHYTDEWALYKYVYNDKNQKAFLFSIQAPQGGYSGFYPDIRYKCVLEPMDDNPVLYSVFREGNIRG